MGAIENLNQNITPLIISHRLSTLKNCILIIELGDCGIKHIGSYDEIMSQRR